MLVKAICGREKNKREKKIVAKLAFEPPRDQINQSITSPTSVTTRPRELVIPYRYLEHTHH